MPAEACKQQSGVDTVLLTKSHRIRESEKRIEEFLASLTLNSLFLPKKLLNDLAQLIQQLTQILMAIHKFVAPTSLGDVLADRLSAVSYAGYIPP
jgi:hypothetical protein